jgi:hypothetical protein
MEKAEVVKAIEEEQKKIEEEEEIKKELKMNEVIKKYQEDIKKLEEMMETKRETTIVKEDMEILEMDEEGNISVKQTPFKKGEEITQKEIESQKNNLLKKLEEKEQKFREMREVQSRKKKQQTAFDTYLKALEEKFINYYPQIVEANSIAEFLNRRIKFIPFIAYMYSQNKNPTTDEIRKCIKIKVVNEELGYIYIWDLDTFDNRVSMFQEVIDYFFQENAILYNEQENDPFWDPPSLVYYAEGVSKQKEIIYRFDLKKDIILSSYIGENGIISMEIVPCDETGGMLEEDDLDDIDTPEDLIEKNMPAHFIIKFNTIKFTQESLMGLKFVIKCEVNSDNGVEVISTEENTISNMEMALNFEKLILVSKVTPEIINHYVEKLFKVEIYIENTEKVEKLGRMDSPVLKDTAKPTKVTDFQTRPSVIGKRMTRPSKALNKNDKKMTRMRKGTKGGKAGQNKKDCMIF